MNQKEGFIGSRSHPHQKTIDLIFKVLTKELGEAESYDLKRKIIAELNAQPTKSSPLDHYRKIFGGGKNI
jgi:hypothetical protein